VIAENGFFNSPISTIAARAGVADGTVYLYFKSKDQILRAAIDTAFLRFFERVRAEMADTKNAEQQLRILVRLHLETLAANHALAVVMQTEVRQSARFIAEFSRQHLVDYLNLTREVIRRGQQQGVFRADASDRTVAHCLFGALDEMVSSWVFTERPFEPATTASQVLDVIFRGIETTQPHA
jgi:TetR/AcrR family fatty acid metabolism transcriptional regulator